MVSHRSFIGFVHHIKYTANVFHVALDDLCMYFLDKILYKKFRMYFLPSNITYLYLLDIPDMKKPSRKYFSHPV